MAGTCQEYSFSFFQLPLVNASQSTYELATVLEIACFIRVLYSMFQLSSWTGRNLLSTWNKYIWYIRYTLFVSAINQSTQSWRHSLWNKMNDVIYSYLCEYVYISNCWFPLMFVLPIVELCALIYSNLVSCSSKSQVPYSYCTKVVIDSNLTLLLRGGGPLYFDSGLPIYHNLWDTRFFLFSLTQQWARDLQVRTAC